MLATLDILALKLISGIGDVTIRKIITSNLEIKDLYHLSSAELKSIFRSEKDLLKIKESFGGAYEKAEYDFQRYMDNNITVIGYFESKYPINLTKIDDFPILLFCSGNVELLKSKKNVAVIGTRDNSQVGNRIASITSTYFANEGFTIVSGLARGIDSIAHEAALDAKGSTIAVLVDVTSIYPKENYKLARRIIEEGSLMISENTPGTFQSKSSFVVRDRLQSGLSIGVFPIETDVQGGTMHTVGFAKKQNRLIFVPDVKNQALLEMYSKDIVGVDFSKIRGIKHLIDSGVAIPYTKDAFNDIKVKLEEHTFGKTDQVISKVNEGYSYDLFSSFNKTVKVLDETVSNDIMKPVCSTSKDDLKEQNTSNVECESNEFSLESLSTRIISEFELLSNFNLDDKQKEKLIKTVEAFCINVRKVSEQKGRRKKRS